MLVRAVGAQGSAIPCPRGLAWPRVASVGMASWIGALAPRDAIPRPRTERIRRGWKPCAADWAGMGREEGEFEWGWVVWAVSVRQGWARGTGVI